MKFDIWVFFKNLSKKIHVSLKLRQWRILYMTACVQVYLWLVFRRILRKIRNVSDKTYKLHKIKTHFMFDTFLSENCVVCQIMWKSMAEPERPQMITRRMRLASCITKAADTHSEYVTLIACPRQQGFRESNSILRNTYTAFLKVYIYRVGIILDRRRVWPRP